MTIPERFKTWFPAIALGLILVVVLGFFFFTARDPKPQESASHPEPERMEGRDDNATAAMRLTIESAASDDFPELMRSILQGKRPEDQTSLVTRLLQRWLVEDMGSFVVFLNEAELNGLDLWDQLAPGMAEAIRAVKDQIPDPGLLGQLVERVLIKAAETDPKSTLAWARELLSGEHLDSTLAGIAPELARLDPKAAIELLDEVEAFPKQMQAAAGVGLALGRSDHPLAMTWAESFFSETERAFALSGVLSGMADRDTGRAAKEYSRVVGEMKSRYREQILADRAKSGNTIDEEYEGLSPAEIEKAELAKPNPSLIYLENATRAIALELSRKNPEEALDWARSMDLYQGKAVAMETIYGEWSSVDPQAAYQSLLGESDRRPEVAGALFETWAMRNATLAAESALSLKAGPEKDSAIEGVARGWIQSGGRPAQIAAWAEQLPADANVDRVRAVVASEAAFDNPELAWKQVERISNPLKRSELFQEVFPNLVEENPKLARAALATIKLSPVEIEYFQHMLGP